MPTSYTSLIGLALPVTGELAGVWGDTVNNYITNYLDSAVAGTQTISGSQTAVTLSVTNGSSLVTAGSGATGSAQFQIINCTGNPAGLLTITAPASSRQYIIINATSTSQSVKIVGTGPTTGVTLIAGEKAHVAWNGSDFVKIATTAAAGGSNTQVQYNSSGVLAGSSNMTFDGTNLTVGGTASATKLIPTGGAITGNGMYLPAANSVSITTNGANAIYIDANQNVGFGTTLAAWGSGAGMKAIQMGGTSFSFLAGSVAQYIYGNAYYDGTNNRYINNGTACSYAVNASGQFQWFQAASGTAGTTISFTQAMTLDSSGNLGLGVTPSAWGANFKAMQIGRGTALWSGTATDATFLSQNAYYDGTNFRYLQSAYASYYSTQLGQHLWYTAPSGTAGNTISFTQAMTLDANGNLGVGSTSPSSYSHGGNNKFIEVRNTNTAVNSQGHFIVSSDCTLASSSVGSFSWVLPSISASNKLVSYVGLVTTSAHTSATPNVGMTFATTDGTAPQERARITSGGDFLVSKTAGNDTSVGLRYVASQYLSIVRDGNPPLYLNRLSSDGRIAEFARSSTIVGSIDVTTTATSYVTSSDYRLKENIQPMTGALAKVAALKPCTYKWKADGSDGEGFIAHELAEVAPQCVTGEKDAVDAEGKPVYQGIDTSFLVATLTAAIQEQQALIQSLTARIAALESKGA